MPKRKSTPSSPLPVVGWVALSALLLFGLGEAYRYARSESGQVAFAKILGLGDPARVTQLMGKRLHAALGAVGVISDSVTERLVEGRTPAVVWRVALKSDASLIQFNAALTRALESRGAEVLSGREAWTDDGAPMLRLVVGLPKRATHELQVVRGRAIPGAAPAEPARLALVLFGFGESAARADSFFAARVPFAVAVVAGGKESHDAFRAAHARGRELVVHLPLEPLNYPQVNPGPGTLLVTMKPAKVAAEVRRYLDQASPVVAAANHMGSLATQDMTLMRALYRELKKSDLPFLHVSPVAGAVCKSLAADVGVDYAEPDLMLDREARLSDTKALDKQWKSALVRARARGHLMVWMRATPLTLRWLPGALTPKRLDGVAVVPLSALLRRPPT
jgi:polysaccharide deacetylase 2 family uncharacterized protein YibQ